MRKFRYRRAPMVAATIQAAIVAALGLAFSVRTWLRDPEVRSGEALVWFAIVAGGFAVGPGLAAWGVRRAVEQSDVTVEGDRVTTQGRRFSWSDVVAVRWWGVSEDAIRGVTLKLADGRPRTIVLRRADYHDGNDLIAEVRAVPHERWLDITGPYLRRPQKTEPRP